MNGNKKWEKETNRGEEGRGGEIEGSRAERQDVEINKRKKETKRMEKRRL